jgi:hypothetical protein
MRVNFSVRAPAGIDCEIRHSNCSVDDGDAAGIRVDPCYLWKWLGCDHCLLRWATVVLRRFRFDVAMVALRGGNGRAATIRPRPAGGLGGKHLAETFTRRSGTAPERAAERGPTRRSATSSTMMSSTMMSSTMMSSTMMSSTMMSSTMTSHTASVLS